MCPFLGAKNSNVHGIETDHDRFDRLQKTNHVKDINTGKDHWVLAICFFWHFHVFVTASCFYDERLTYGRITTLGTPFLL